MSQEQVEKVIKLIESIKGMGYTHVSSGKIRDTVNQAVAILRPLAEEPKSPELRCGGTGNVPKRPASGKGLMTAYVPCPGCPDCQVAKLNKDSSFM